MSQFKTEQEGFWYGKFGDEYSSRNISEYFIASNIALFSSILSKTSNVHSIIEFGANIGLNLRAIRALLPKVELAAIEINKSAVSELSKLRDLTIVYNQSILEFVSEKKWDMTFTKGVLIHINPDFLNQVYEKLYTSSQRYICLVEYYNPTPVEITYRGHEHKLFKRDFAGEMLDKFQDLRLINYGFAYHRDPHFPQDDCTWFLLEKI